MPKIPALRLSEVAYERILEGLFQRRVEVGAFLSQSELSALVDVPVAPLRDALRVLEAEGILTIHPRSGIQFVRPGLELTRATYQFRAIVERAAIRAFAEQGDDVLIAELTADHNALISRIVAQGLHAEDLPEVDRLEQAMHNSVIGIMQNPLIDISYRRMMNYLRLLRLDRKFTSPIILRTLREHVEILTACAKRDADAAEAALHAHLQAAMQRNIGFM
ncbi:MAG: GntR family transcriptional regulator [Paracoccaceae bacterium]